MAELALEPVLRQPMIERTQLVSHLLEVHRQNDFESDFLVLFGDAPLDICRITHGDVTSGQDTAWIGDPAAFNRFQEYFHAVERDLQQAQYQDNLSKWMNCMNDAMVRVVQSSEYESVGGFVVTVTSLPAERDGFRYLRRTAGAGFRTINPSPEPQSILQPLGAEGGGFRYSMLVPKRAGVGAVAIYIPEGSAGALFYPLVQWAPVKFAFVSMEEFIAQVSERYGIAIDGFRFG